MYEVLFSEIAQRVEMLHAKSVGSRGGGGGGGNVRDCVQLQSDSEMYERAQTLTESGYLAVSVSQPVIEVNADSAGTKTVTEDSPCNAARDSSFP